MSAADYNEDSVHYCSQCLYLGNPQQIDGMEYCPYCGSIDFDNTHIEIWESKFEKKYKQGKFLKLKKTWQQIMEANQKEKI